MPSYKVEKWSGAMPPSEAEIQQLLKEQDLSGYTWSNSPRGIYNAHTHSFHKVIFVLRGSIRFGLISEGEQVTLYACERLDLPAHILHDAVVGSQGVVCIETHR